MAATAALAATALAFSMGGPALASESAVAYSSTYGTTACTSNQTLVVWSVATGTVTHLMPGGYAPSFHNYSDYVYRESSNTIAGGGSWTVSTTGSIRTAGAYCINGRP
jgi:hypothetical protein